MVQIYQGETAGGRIGKAFGEGLSSGLEMLTQAHLQGMVDRKKDQQQRDLVKTVARQDGLPESSLDFLLSKPQEYQDAYVKSRFKDPDFMEAMAQGPQGEAGFSEQLGSQGQVKEESFWEKLTKPQGEAPKIPPQETEGISIQQGQDGSSESVWEKLTKPRDVDVVGSVAETAGKGLGQIMGLGGWIAEKLGGTSNPEARQYIQKEATRALEGIIDGASLGTMQRKSEIPEEQKSAFQEIYKMIGSVVPIGQLAKGLGGVSRLLKIPTSWAARSAISGTAFSSFTALDNAFRKKEITPGELGANFALGFGLHAAFEGAGALTRVIASMAKKSKVNPSALTASIVEDASKAGIDVEAALKGDKEAVKDLTKFAKKVSKEKPSLINERVNQMYEDYAGGEEQARKARVLDDQNLYPEETKRVRKEVVKEKARVEEAKAKAAPKEGKPPTKSQLAKEELKAKAAEKFPDAKLKYRNAKSELSNAKVKLRVAQNAKSPKAELAKLENSVARLESNLETVGEDLKKVAYERKSGKKFKTKKDLYTYAENEAENVREKIKYKTDAEILKNNELEKLAKKYKSRRAIPGSERIPEDTHLKILDAREKAFTKRLDKVKSELKYAGDEASKLLKREEDVLNKLIKQAQGRRLVHRRRQGLQEMGKTLERQEKLKGQLPETKAAKVARDKLKIRKKAKSTEASRKKLGNEAIKDINEGLKKAESTKKKEEVLKKMLAGFFPRGLITGGTEQKTRAIITLIGKIAGTGYVGGEAGKFIKKLIANSNDREHAKNIHGLAPYQKTAYYNGLKDSGVSPKRIKEIRVMAKAA